jgi:hypothetical protein
MKRSRTLLASLLLLAACRGGACRPDPGRPVPAGEPLEPQPPPAGEPAAPGTRP